MDCDVFNTFYLANARSVWAYFASVTSDTSLADDLTQETYLRLTADVDLLDDDHRKHYLFRIASNLILDQYRDGKRIGPTPKPNRQLLINRNR